MVKAARRHVSPRLLEEGGAVSLIELLVAIPILLLVLGATLGLYDLAVHDQTRVEGRVRTIVDEKNGLERISRELRDSIGVRYLSSEVVDAQVTSGGRWARFDCSGTACKRREGPAEGVFDKPSEVLIANVQSSEFELLSDVPGFGLQPDFVNPTYVTVTIKVRVPGATNPVTLNDGFNLRNLTAPS